ncbi:D-galacturonic acid reductase-like protein, partial [Hortaea werneckii]
MAPLNVCMVGTGEYTTGFVGGGMSGSDKKVGVVGLTLFDLRRRGKVGKLSMVGTSGNKFPAIREHLHKNITQAYNGLDTSFESFPGNEERDPEAYKKAIDALSPGDAITIFTPDPTHYPIALYAIQRKIHVMITKPAVKLLSEHQSLIEEAKKNNVFVYIEHHKRFDPAYADARNRAVRGNLGEFNYFYSYMSQPKSQLETFKAWAGKDSDISYYLNSHHIDVCESMVPEYRPTKVMASASKGIATDLGCAPETEDTITLLVDWEKKDGSGRRATGVYTASWSAPQKSGVHSQQYFHYMASKGEVRVNQAKRGYDVTEDEAGLTWYNPFYMKYAPDEEGNFAGQGGYGYVSFEKFVDAIQALKEGRATLDDLDKRGLPTLKNTIATGAILEAGRRSLDEGRPVEV